MIDTVSSALYASPITLATTAEAISPLGIEGIISLVLPKCLLVLLLLIPLWKYKYLGSIKWLLITWSIVIVGATLWQRRFDYYLAIPLSLLVGFAVWRAYELLQSGSSDAVKRYCKGLFVLIVTLILSVCLVLTISMSKSGFYKPPGDWYESLIWVRDNTPAEALIITWWDYGYWVQYIAERDSYVDGGQGSDVKEVAGLFNMGVNETSSGNLSLREDTYIMIDNRTASYCIEAIRLWDDGRQIENPLVQRLYGGVVDGYELVYDSAVKVFRVR